MGYRVAVVGATGNVGREMLTILAEREFPIDEIAAVASSRSPGVEVEFGETGKMLKCPEPRAFRLHRLGHRAVRGRLGGDQGLCAQGRRGGLRGDRQLVALPHGPRRAAGRARGEPRGDRRLSRKRNIIANPNCSTAQMVVALKPLHDAATIKRVVVAPTSRSPAPARRGWTSCSSRAATSSSAIPPCRRKFTKQIAFNVIPHIDVFLDDGSTKEEWKMVVETKKILDPKIKVNATCVRVPVFVGHSRGDQHRVRERDLGRGGAGHPARGARRDADR